MMKWRKQPEPLKDKIQSFDTSHLKMLMKRRIVINALAGIDRKVLILLGMTWVAAIGMVIVSSDAVNRARSSTVDVGVAAQKIPNVPTVALVDIPNERLRLAADTVRGIHPNIRFEFSSRNTVQISTNQVRDMRTWMNALKSFETSHDRIKWSVLEMCIGQSCRPGLFVAELKGQSITIR